MDEFRKLLQTAHANGMYVILDWVPNHTGWDHTWITSNPEFYTRNAAGEITDPIRDDGTPWGWTDVADLNYENPELQKAMIADMMYWVTEEGIDGFRCDVAGGVPLQFWEEAIPQLRAEKELFMLAEAWEPELLRDDLFDMAYAWDGHHTMNAIARGEMNVSHWDEYLALVQERYEDDDILMNFVTNHDENSWAGTVTERMGEGSEALLALAYTMRGMPLIYSGQEYDLDHRLKFFEKDSIPKTKAKMWPVLARLAKLKMYLPAANGGKEAAAYQKIITSAQEQVLVFRRTKENSELVYLANLSQESVEFTMEWAGTYHSFMDDTKVELHENAIHKLGPWEYMILTNGLK